MAADTAQKRYSASDPAIPWRGPRVIPSGSVGAAARRTLLTLYSFGEASTPVVAPTITTTSLPAGYVDVPYSQFLQATGDPVDTWSVDLLPDGLTLNSVTGEVSGVPTTIEAVDSTFDAENAGGSNQKLISMSILDTPTPLEGGDSRTRWRRSGLISRR